MSILIRGGRLIDPSQGLDRVGDLLIEGSRIAGIDTETQTADEVLDASGLIVAPGFIDLHVGLREPGYEEDETTETGTAAALAGGFTSIACMPDTNPIVDNRGAAEFILLQAERAGNARVFPLGAVTRELGGEELAEIGQLVEGGAVGFTDGHQPVANAEVMRRALEYTRMFDKPILNLPQVPELVAKGVIHEGHYSMLLGLGGMPAAAQDIMVGRDIALAELTEGRLHLMCITTANAVEQIRQARRRGVQVTCDVTPHHLTLTDASMRSFDTHFKVNPPLRSPEHVEALLAGLQDGTVSAISSDHQPLATEKKQVEVDLAPFGIVGLETLLSVCVRTLLHSGLLDWPQLIEKLTVGPARILNLDAGTLATGGEADVVLIDPDASWTVDSQRFRSKSRNTPFEGAELPARVRTTIVSGSIRYRDSEV